MKVSGVYLSALAILCVFGIDGSLAQGNPAAELQQVFEEGYDWMFDLATAVGVFASIAVPVLTYMNILPKDYFKWALFITATIMILPQIIKFMFDLASGT